MTKLLVYRFSAMGDVVLLLPVLRGVLDTNPNVEVYLLTKPVFFPVFQNIDRLYLVSADFTGKNRSLIGLLRLFKSIKDEIKPDLVVDVHQVIRTFILNMFFRFSGYRVITFDKGRKEKKRIIRTKRLEQLPTTVERYSNVFTGAGFKVRLPDAPVFRDTPLPAIFKTVFMKGPPRPLFVGIAPLAKHKQKIWGLSKTRELISQINKRYNATIFLFGGGKNEVQALNELAGQFDNCYVTANHFDLSQEISILKEFNVMVSMDSANMHIAAMAGIPTVSIWGATHTAFGFGPYKQPPENVIQYTGDKLPCRPCSVYGNKKCIFAEIKCMEYIPVKNVLDRLAEILPQ